MSDLEPGPQLVGRKVCNPLRPDWGVGEVLRVQTTTADGQPQHRVSIQFAAGHRVLLVPPARLVDPQPEAGRQVGWLDSLGRSTLDDRLRDLPDDVLNLLGSPAQRIHAVAELYKWEDTPDGLVRWARRQTLTADPLAHWSRDELHQAFAEFCRRRDAYFRAACAAWRKAEGGKIDRALEQLDAPLRARLLTALRAGGA